MAGSQYSADEQRIRDLAVEWANVANTRKVDDIIKFYASDATIVWPGKPAAYRTEALRGALEAMFRETPTLTMIFEPERIEVARSGDFASDFGKVTFGWIGPDGKPGSIVDKYVVVWKKIDGDWKVFYDCYNSNAPAA